MNKLIRVRLDSVPERVTEEVRRTTGDYAIPLVVDYLPLGSGTLVQIDQSCGILTAEHAVNHPSKPHLRLNYTGHPERLLRTAVGPFPHDLSISTNALRIVTSIRASEDYGPDLAFIALPAEAPFLHELKARKSFYNLTVKTAERKAAALDDVGFFALCGFPAVRDFTEAPSHGFTTVNGLYGYAMFTGPDKYEERNDWDYYEMGVSQESANEFERTFGGVSGGAVWRVEMQRREDAQLGSEYMSRITLAGVAFYEMDDRDQKRFFVRSHGPCSIYEKLINLVRKTLA
jgi:hypothetical protein